VVASNNKANSIVESSAGQQRAGSQQQTLQKDVVGTVDRIIGSSYVGSNGAQQNAGGGGAFTSVTAGATSAAAVDGHRTNAAVVGSSTGNGSNGDAAAVTEQNGGSDGYQFMVPPPLITKPSSVSEEIQVLMSRKKHIQTCQLLLLEKVAAKSKTIEVQIAEIHNRGWNIVM
jgi:hypothetical protein